MLGQCRQVRPWHIPGALLDYFLSQSRSWGCSSLAQPGTGCCVLCRDTEYSHLTQSCSLIPLQPGQPGTTASLGSGLLPGAGRGRGGAPGAGNVSWGTGHRVGTAQGGRGCSAPRPGCHRGWERGSTLCFSCISEEKTGVFPTPGSEPLQGLGRAVLWAQGEQTPMALSVLGVS